MMDFDEHDLLFKCLKEYIKQGLQNDIHQQCEKMRLAVIALAPEQRERCFAMIDECERARQQRIESDALRAYAAKEEIKAIEKVRQNS